ncbi:MAG: hypothetical protein JNJ90_11615 [Saprospiraceae bacterium]|jgi:hypothetical protein|nr:hypothetical protein [Saprospiraceae bacterium]
MHASKTYQLLAVLSTLSVAVWGCRKDVQEFIPYKPVLENLDQLLLQTPDPTTRSVFQFGGAVIPDTILTSTSGVRVFLADTENLFADNAGTPVPCSTCPSLKVEVTTVLRKGDFLARKLPTSTYPDSEMLESAGAVQVRVLCGNKELQVLPSRYLKVQIPTASTNQSNMTVYTGVLDAEKNLSGWSDTNEPAFLAKWPLPGSGDQQDGYELIIPQTGWSNCARPLNEQSSSFCVTLPEQFTALNARVFLVFKNNNAIAELTGDDESSEFCFPQAPLGYPVTIVVVGKTGEQYWLTNLFTEIGTNVQLSVTPVPMQEQDLLNFLKNL